MQSFVTKTVGALASFLAEVSAHKPIHVILLTTLVVSVAYLSVFEEYVGRGISYNDVSFYHAPGSDDYNGWEQISDWSLHPDANHLAITSLKFKSVGERLIPSINGTFQGFAASERVLIVNYDEISSVGDILSGETTWKIRHHHGINKYAECLRSVLDKLKSLIRGAETFDIALITLAYLVMMNNVITVFFDMQKQGSKFWMAFVTLLSSTFAFILALATCTKILDVQIPFLSITEGVPFLVAIVGFKNKTLLTSAILRQSQVLDVRSLISKAVYENTGKITRDHFVVGLSFFICSLYATQFEGLRVFSLLSALILANDLLLTFTFYAACLALKLEIGIIRVRSDFKSQLEEDGISASVADSVTRADEKLSLSSGATVISLKVALLASVFATHAYWLGTKWINGNDDTDLSSLTAAVAGLSKAAVKHVSVGPSGTIVTVMPSRIYVPSGAFLQTTDVCFYLLEKVSASIRDPLISKFLLFAFAFSVTINAYFLNAARATSIPASKDISRAKSSRRASKSVASVPVMTPPQEFLVKESSLVSDESSDEESEDGPFEPRSVEECTDILKAGNVKQLHNNEVASLVVAGKLPLYALEKQLADNTRAVVVRRKAIAKLANASVLDTARLPYKGYDYDRVFGACCENVIGYMPIPVGVAGPMIIDGKPYHIPMATTEGCLVASTMRGCKAINAGGGVETVLTKDGMTRGPCVTFASLARAGAAKIWLDSEEGSNTIKKAFNSTSRFARLQNIQTALAGTLLFIRFTTTTGDAMGMNMISKGVEYSLKYMTEEAGWDDMEVISVSGNYCTDKKPAAINWIEGRGKSIVAEARIPADVVRKVLKSDVDALVELNISKNLIGSAMAGSIGGFNAHAANLVTAVYLATGQDPAQNVESSNCITLMKNVGGDLVISVSMPSIEVGTIGGGTILEPQGAMLDLLGVRGPHPTEPGANARQLAKIVASAVLAAELSLCSALAAGHLVQSHMQHNRKGAVAAPAAPQDVARLQEGAKICMKG
ncbi:hypothetical protein BABINDRAFT_161905 [Babjeviella inositovora NRRL Y-12698]|uniref:3-hydroxy-3-methylglutaryl coenzyme A reductase n=1 Tax=Babjeviella inositovora NRRL Y-12698 TaxID=984486 RepID=A0A1E3QP92_9ASCO|nr:uncharacterized protein BABINDRAFT_161905 [Babjeviella inositovora NRRL Y-12698]ODQ79513.1 hypothetical protein BABINDRAFT_161905 [Babjeviella inositovora NRRL Y-12698]